MIRSATGTLPSTAATAMIVPSIGSSTPLSASGDTGEVKRLMLRRPPLKRSQASGAACNKDMQTSRAATKGVTISTVRRHQQRAELQLERLPALLSLLRLLVQLSALLHRRLTQHGHALGTNQLFARAVLVASLALVEQLLHLFLGRGSRATVAATDRLLFGRVELGLVGCFGRVERGSVDFFGREEGRGVV